MESNEYQDSKDATAAGPSHSLKQVDNQIQDLYFPLSSTESLPPVIDNAYIDKQPERGRLLEQDSLNSIPSKPSASSEYSDNIEMGQVPYAVSLHSASGLDSSDTERLMGAEESTKAHYLLDLEDMPQGRHLGVFSTIVLFVSRMLGSGIFALAPGIYRDCGNSVFWFLTSWLIAGVMSFCGMYVYLELGSIIPRSGGNKVFLEYIYQRPKLLATVAFLVFSVIFGFSISNVLIFGEYFLHSIGLSAPTDTQIKICGLVYLYIVAAFHGVSIHLGVKIQNFLGALKVGMLVFFIMAGTYSIVQPGKQELHWRVNPKEGAMTVASFTTATIRATYAFAGWNSVHTVTNEIKNPNRTFKIAGPTSLILTTASYVLINLAYLLSIPEKEFLESGTLVGARYFQTLFGEGWGQKILVFSVALSTGGNIFVVLYTLARTIQEVFREGYLPFGSIMGSNKPFGAPLPAIILSCTFSTIVMILFAGGNFYEYIIALESYPQQIFTFLVALGVFILRKRDPDFRAPIRSTMVGTGLFMMICVYLSVSPLFGNSNPPGTESWISYPILSLSILFGCIFYWFSMFKLGPWLGNYELEKRKVTLGDGLVIQKWHKIYH